MRHAVDDFQLGDRAMRDSLFAPRLYNYCLSLGLSRARMMPSRAFCSHESQGYPIIPAMQHSGAFPFDRGRVGGKVATDRHRPHAHHGEDLVIVHASHVGCDLVRRARRARKADFGFERRTGFDELSRHASRASLLWRESISARNVAMVEASASPSTRAGRKWR